MTVSPDISGHHKKGGILDSKLDDLTNLIEVYRPNKPKSPQIPPRILRQKVFINNDGEAVFVCPKCQKAMSMNVSIYKNIDEPIKITHWCSCGYSYTPLLERRRFHRKAVRLPGVCMLEREKAKRSMIVRDISRGGLKLELKDTAPVKLGDKLLVMFRLDDRPKTVIQKKATIRNVKGTFIGVEFYFGEADNKAEKAIVHYTFATKM
jgi:hypothetical protein